MGECSIPSSPNASAPIWVEYPTTEYCKLVSDSIKASFPYLLKLLTSKLLIFDSNFAPLPAGVTLTLTLSCWYWRPPSSIITFLILPSSTTAFNLAPSPVPNPTTSKSGAEEYSWPFVCIST